MLLSLGQEKELPYFSTLRHKVEVAGKVALQTADALTNLKRSSSVFVIDSEKGSRF